MIAYTIEFNYNASIVVTVKGDFKNEGEALDAARNIAEDSDNKQFTINNEISSNILKVE